MKLHYYAETDSLYVELKDEPGAETREISDGLNVDLGAAGQVIGIDIDHASSRLDLSTINEEAWSTLRSDTSRPFDRPSSGRIAVKVINHLGDEVMKVFRV